MHMAGSVQYRPADPNSATLVSNANCISVWQEYEGHPTALDRRSTELIVSPKKVVGCRGGRRNVEG